MAEAWKQRSWCRLGQAKSGLALVSVFALLVLTPAAHANEPAGGSELASALLSWISTHASGILSTAYDRAPVLVTVLAAMLILPVTAMAALLTQGLRLKLARTRQGLPAPPPAAPATELIVQPIAWLVTSQGDRHALPTRLELVRIGRHEDSDICISASTVHRYHAIIHRMPHGGFVIRDVSGAEGNGILVNETRVSEAHLMPGDRIQLGHSRFVFETALPAYAVSVSATVRSANSMPIRTTTG